MPLNAYAGTLLRPFYAFCLLSSGQILLSNQASIIVIDIYYSSNSLPLSPQGNYENGTWDYLVLTQSWPAGYCQFTKCAYPRVISGFNIHGLWAQIWPATSMNECSNGTKYDNNSIQDIYEQLKNEWVDEKDYSHPWKFWHHEWTKHGVCVAQNNKVITNQYDYFAASLRLKRMYNFTEIFKRNHIVPSNTTLYDTSSVLETMKKDLGINIRLQCSWRGNEDARLVEARICVNKHFKLIDCPNEEALTVKLPSTTQALQWTTPCPRAFVFPS